MSVARRALSRTGIVLVVIGGIWILQGLNILPGSFMTGQRQWAYRGAGIAIVGLLMVRFTRSRR
jgi:hypothetical protein